VPSRGREIPLPGVRRTAEPAVDLAA